MARRAVNKGPKSVLLWKAEEVAVIAQGLIADFHQHLTSHKIVYAFQSKGLKARGQAAWGTAEVVGGKAAAFEKGLPAQECLLVGQERFFLIRISAPAWKNLSDAQKRALVDHELAHCGVNGNGSPTIWPHDLEEFRAIVERHGYWREDVERMAKTMVAAQPALPLDEKAEKPAESKKSRPTLTAVPGGAAHAA